MSTDAQNNAPDQPGDAAPEASDVTRERDEFRDKYLRLQAEFANYQKRAKAQAENDRLYMIRPLALDLLDVLDNFERAMQAASNAGAAGIVSGLEMVHKQMLGALAKNGVEAIPAIGQPFDPNYHEALMQQPDADHPEGTVVAELGKGYKLNDRVLRPTKVAVSVKPAS